MDAMKKAILNMWNKGLSGYEIAHATGKTRNSIMGLLFRMKKQGLVVDRKIFRTKEQTPPPPQPPAPTPVKVKKRSISKVRIPLLFEPPPTDKNTHITDLTYNTCRYIVTDVTTYKNTYYCGQAKERGSYCAYHAQMCYVSHSEYKELVKDDPPTRSRFAFGNT